MSALLPPTNPGPVKKRKTAKLPVTLLGGFLGAGKTTLLRHILETKHGEGPFRCAVIVNDMAELNVDKSLVEESALVQSDEVVAMQNGCVCCTLKNDLTEQIYALSKSGRFDYMVIEASGISEPSQIASAFNEDHSHEADHGHHADHDHSAPDLGTHAVLDTCCTVVSAAEFFENFESVTPGSNKESWPRLMVEQIEYANVIIVNKADLVSKAQLAQIEKHVCVLNPSAKVITAQNSSINVSEVVNTGLYDASSFKSIVDMVEELELGDTTTSDCCAESIARGEKACCSKKSRTIKTFLSEVILGSATLPKTRHETRFGITSFCYKARRPFNPGRLMKFVDKYFVVVDSKEEEVDGDDRDDDPQLEEWIKGQQAEAKSKQALRAKDLGVVLRSKGFIWTAHSHDLMGTLGSAGNTLTITSDGTWHCLDARVYDDDCDREVQRKLKKDFKAPWGDRRQEIVFIGLEMKHKAIQEALDDCLLDDDEFSLGLDGWKATMGDMFLFKEARNNGSDSDEEDAMED